MRIIESVGLQKGCVRPFSGKAKLIKEVFFMATSSITKNFVISGKDQVEMFVNAIEESGC